MQSCGELFQLGIIRMPIVLKNENLTTASQEYSECFDKQEGLTLIARRHTRTSSRNVCHSRFSIFQRVRVEKHRTADLTNFFF